MKTSIPILLLAALLCGCAAMQPKIIGGPDDYGTYPTDYTNVVHSYITETFKDPDSVKGLEIREPTKFIQKQKLDFGIWGSTENRTYGYLIFFRSNAKNSYGGYTGIHDFSLFVRNGTVLYSHDLTAEIQSLR